VGLRGACALLVALSASTAGADGPPARVLASSGSVVDDFPIARFVGPAAPADGRVVFRGVTTLLHVTEDGSERTILRTGDALPAPLSGTVNEIVDAAVNARGTLAVAADVNSPGSTGAILLRDGGIVTPVAVDAGDPGFTGVAIEGAADLLYWDGTGVFVRRAAGTPEMIGGLAGRKLRLRPLLADGPAAAWIAGGAGLTGDVSFWSPDSGTVVFSQGNLGSSATVRLGLALDPRFGVAFTARTTSATGAFLWSVRTRTTSILARVGGRVGDALITRFRGQIAFLEDGTVTFRANLGRGTPPLRRSAGWVHAKDGVLELTSKPVLAVVAGPTSRIESVGAVFAIDGGVARRLIGPGDRIAGGGTVASVESHAARDGGVAAVVTTEKGDERVVHRRGTRLASVAVKKPLAEPVPQNVTIDVADRDVVLLSGGVAWSGRRRLVRLEPPRRFARAGFLAQLETVAGNRVVVLGIFDGSANCGGVFVARGRRLRPLAILGSPTLCGADALPVTSVYPLAASADQLVLIGAGSDGARRLWRLLPGPLTSLGTTVAREDGTRVELVPLDVTLAGERPVFVAATPEDSTVRQLFLAGVPATRLLREGDPTPVGTLRFDGDAGFAAGTVDGVVVAASVRGGGVRRALVVQDIPR
jgi:hypothetical protein